MPAKAGSDLVRTAEIRNARGLHARAAAKFVKCAERFEADILVRRQGNEVSGVSIMGLMMLAASKGTEIEIVACGPDAAAAVEALLNLIDGRFEEQE